MKLFTNIKSHWKVWRVAQIFSIKIVRREDVHGRTYRSAYYKYGHKEMLEEYLGKNTWTIK